MQTVIWAGGRGTRLHGAESDKLKPMTMIGNKPIVEHIMGIYSHFGYGKFVLLGGYNFPLLEEHVMRNMNNYDRTVEAGKTVSRKHTGRLAGKILLLDTGEDTEMGGRLLRAKKHLGEVFFATYGDGVAKVNIPLLLVKHKRMGTLATVTRMKVQYEYGLLEADENDIVTRCSKEAHVDGGFFVLQKKVLDHIEGDGTPFSTVTDILTNMGQLAQYRHDSFWMAVNTQEQLKELVALYNTGAAPWKFKEKYQTQL